MLYYVCIWNSCPICMCSHVCVYLLGTSCKYVVYTEYTILCSHDFHKKDTNVHKHMVFVCTYIWYPIGQKKHSFLNNWCLIKAYACAYMCAFLSVHHESNQCFILCTCISSCVCVCVCVCVCLEHTNVWSRSDSNLGLRVVKSYITQKRHIWQRRCKFPLHTYNR